jgi:thioredoxin 1
MALQITDNTFETEVLASDKVAIVDFWAKWCGPCISLINPIFEELTKEYEGRAVVAKVDVDTNPKTAIKYNIRSAPTILVIKNGEVVEKQVGAIPKAKIVKMLDKHL